MHFLNQMAHFNRERVPERNVHAKGSGAFGEFETTEDVSAYTKAAVFQPGVTTEMLARFSTVAGEQGSPDTWRDPRGFALKFYTSEGNYDLVGNNTPVFFIRDTMKFPHFIRSQKRRGGSGLRDNNMQWDFWSLNPESAHQVTYLMGDRGIPRSYRHMNGYGSHTYLWVNEAGEKHWVKYHFHSDQGVEGITHEDATRIAGEDADFHRRDLYDAIARRRIPELDALGAADALRGGEDLPDQPVRPDEDLAAPRLPADQGRHDDAEQEPGELLRPDRAGGVRAQRTRPGIGISPDKMLLGRAFAYADTHRHRIGPNYLQLPVNRPRVEVNTYTQDGAMATSTTPTTRSTRRTPSAAGTPTGRRGRGRLGVRRRDGPAGVHAAPDDDDWSQAGTLVRDVWNDESARLVKTVAGTCSAGSRASARARLPVLEERRRRDRQADRGAGPGRRRGRWSRRSAREGQPDDSDPIVETRTQAGDVSPTGDVEPQGREPGGGVFSDHAVDGLVEQCSACLVRRPSTWIRSFTRGWRLAWSSVCVGAMDGAGPGRCRRWSSRQPGVGAGDRLVPQ